jgi:Ca-activated chloride channel homolog
VSAWRDVFVRGELWPLAVLLLAAYLLCTRLAERRRVRRLRELAGARAAELLGGHDPRRRSWRGWAGAAALGLALVALLEPAFGVGARRLERRGADIVVCLDVSRSMLARDAMPNRLDAARGALRAMTARSRGDRFALVLFAGDARLVCPLTRDLRSFHELADLADPLAARGGTDLGAALAAAAEAFTDPPEGPRVVVLATDGEDLEERGLRAARELRSRRIVVHGAAFGSVSGGKIPVPSGDGGESFVRDAAGEEVLSAMDPAGLRRIARAGGGEVVEAAASADALVRLYERHIAPSAAGGAGTDLAHERATRFQWPAFAAYLLLVAELALGERRRA